MGSNLLVVVDNEELYQDTQRIIREQVPAGTVVRFVTSRKGYIRGLRKFDLTAPDGPDNLGRAQDVILSLHCQQIFPPWLVRHCRCYNIHPGLLPHGRGMYPYVFALAREERLGATLHEMDEQLDHGRVIAQLVCPYNHYETCEDFYFRIRELEITLVRDWIAKLVTGTFTYPPAVVRAGPVRTREDYQQLCVCDLNEPGTFGEFVRKLQALTFDGQCHARFRDPYGNLVRVGILLEKVIED